MKTSLSAALRRITLFPYRFLRWMMLARPIRFTRFGTFYILFAIGVGAAAINTGNNLLYLILGILLGFIVISGFLSDSGLWGIQTEWIPRGTLYAGQKTPFDCRVSKGWFPGVSLSVKSFWKGLDPTLSFIPWIPARGSVLLKEEVLPMRRGTLTLERCQVASHFPFGLFEKWHSWEKKDRWIVYPTLQTLPAHFFQQRGESPSQHASAHAGLGATPFALRDYRSGDALRQVSWKTSAKRQRLIIKETEEEANQGDLFYLHAWPLGWDEAKMDRFISFIASLIFTIHDQGRPVGLAVPEAFFAPDLTRQHLRRILEFLALVDPATSGIQKSRKHAPLAQTRTMDIQTLWTNGKGNRDR